MDQMQIVSLNCKNCGSTLSISQDLDQFACGYCGTQLVVERTGGIIHLKLIAENMKSVQRATDKTAAELALSRLNQEIESLSQDKHDIIAGCELKIEERKEALQIVTNVIGGVVAVSVLFLSMALLSSGFVSGLIVGCIIGAAAKFGLMAYLQKTPGFNVNMLRESKSETIAYIDQRIKTLKQKYDENYKIANS